MARKFNAAGRVAACTKKQPGYIEYSSEHMLSLINEILDFTKIEAGKMGLGNQLVNCKELTEKMITKFNGQVKAKGLRITT